MTVKCQFCNDTRQEPGVPGPCSWCDPIDEVLARLNLSYCGASRTTGHGESETCGQRGYGNTLDQCGACAKKDLAAAIGREVSLVRLQNKHLARIASLLHVGQELTGVIDEYRAMPCDSLRVRMFNTADRYRERLTKACQTCYDKGYVMGDFDEASGRFARLDCRDCAVTTNVTSNAHCPHCGICHTHDETCATARARIASLTSR